MAETFFRVRLLRVPASLEDQLTTHAFEHEALGVSEALSYVQPDLTYDPRLVPVRSHDLDVYFQNRPARAFFDGVSELSAQIQWSLHEEENKDWLAEWKKGFKPFRLVGPYWVVPSWEDVPAECKTPLRIDPGMAFGTGTHATTQMMAFFIHKLAEKHSKEIADWTLLDVGTGTAILAMLARKAGFGLVTGLEIDPEARRVGRENTLLNELGDINIPDTLLDETDDVYDVVVANIIDGVLLHLRQDLLRTTRPGGYLLLTGILQERDSEFFEGFFKESGLKVVRRLEKDEWVGYWAQRSENG